MPVDTLSDKTGRLSDSIAETQAAILRERKINEALLNLVRVIQPEGSLLSPKDQISSKR
jgi:hypothetical protein